jgi:hypothetical protein
MSETKTPSIESYLWGLAILVGFLLLLGGGYFVWSRYNPYFHLSDVSLEAQAIVSAARSRALTAAEFAACVRLCDSDELSVRLSALASLEAAVGRSAEYKTEAVEVLKRVAAGKDPKASAAATAVLKRLSAVAAP